MSIIKKIAKARAEFGDVTKNVQGYGYRYADLDGIMKAINPGLIAQELHVYHTFQPVEIFGLGHLEITCHVSDGESELTSSIPLPLVGITGTSVNQYGKAVERNAAQEMGKLLTYGRRYSLCAALCITADEDTDAVSKEQIDRHNDKETKKQAAQASPASSSKSTKPVDKVAEVKEEIKKVVALKVEERRFVASEQAWIWLEGLMDKYKLAEDMRQPIRGAAVGKTVPELEQLAQNSSLGVTYEAVHTDDEANYDQPDIRARV